jgi:hypothetical protein
MLNSKLDDVQQAKLEEEAKRRVAENDIKGLKEMNKKLKDQNEDLELEIR